MTTATPAVPRRVVAIVGRPNVGKSSIFNRLVHRRAAIVHPESGVTRDRLAADVAWEGHAFQLVDTGGVSLPEEAPDADSIEAGVRRQVRSALAEAAVAIVVTDVNGGVHHLDEAVVALVRKSGRRAFIVANKADNAERDDAAADFARFGLPVFPVSAVQSRGFDSLWEAVVGALPPDEAAAAATAPLKVAVVGRPNVGKSSYINRLLRYERVIVSAVPGTTRDSIDVPFRVRHGGQERHYLLIDTAGLREVRKVDTAVETFSQMRTEASIRRADVVALMLDASGPPTAQDRKIAALIAAHGRGCVMVANKWDLLSAREANVAVHVRAHLPFMGHYPLVFVSARTGHHLWRSLDAVERVAAAVRTTLSTGVLNRALSEATRKVAPPAPKGRALKIFYAVQIGQSPMRIKVFVNHRERLSKAYRDYLVRSLRERFDLVGVPIVLVFETRQGRGGAVR